MLLHYISGDISVHVELCFAHADLCLNIKMLNRSGRQYLHPNQHSPVKHEIPKTDNDRIK